MYRHTFFVILENKELGTSRIAPLFSSDFPFVATKTVRLELESLALSSSPFTRLLSKLKDTGFAVSSSMWNIEFVNNENKENHEIPSQEID